MATPVLTVARNALWQAIDNWPALRGYFREKLRFDAPDNPFPIGEKVGFGKLPGITIVPNAMKPVWKAHRIQQWEYSCDVVIWVPHWNVAEVEKISQYITEAAYQCGAATTSSTNALPTYIEAAGCGPVELGGMTIKRTKLGDAKPNARVTEVVMTFILRPRVDPQGNL